MQRSIIYCATRKTDLIECMLSIKSVRDIYGSDAHIVVCTDNAGYVNPMVDEILVMDKVYHSYRDKIYALKSLELSSFLLLDCDTFVIENIDDLFRLTDRFDLAVAHAPYRWTMKIDEVPESFPEYNTGVMMVKNSKQFNHFLKAWDQLYVNYESYAKHDQPSFREALYKSSLNISTLTPEYNCRFNAGAMVSHKVKILHGRSEDLIGIAKTINEGPTNSMNLPVIRWKKYRDDIKNSQHK